MALRRAALENAIALGEMKGCVFTPVMRDLLERQSLGLLTEAEFDREVLGLSHPPRARNPHLRHFKK